MAGNKFRARERASTLANVYWRIRPVVRAAALAAVVGALLAVGWQGVLRSPYFRVRNIDVTEGPHFPRDEIIERVGLDRPINVFQFDADAARDALLTHPWVADAKVTTTLPDRATVEISERKAAGVIALDGLYLVDGTGRPFVRAKAGAAAGLPVITGVTRASYDAEPEHVEARIREALSVARLYTRTPLAAAWPLNGLHLATGGRTELLLGQTRVVLGRGAFKVKLERLGEVLGELKRRKKSARYILLSEDGKRAIVSEKPLEEGLDGSLSLR